MKFTQFIYGKAGKEFLRMLVQKPIDWKTGDQRTAIVWIHGGGWKAGCAGQFIKHMDYFSKKGAVSFSIQYRLQTEFVTIEDCLSDCRSAIRYLRDHSEELGIDPNKIVVGGDSAGGHLACCLGHPAIVKSEKDRADLVLDFNGVVDMTRSFKKCLLGDDMEKNPISISRWKEQYDRAYNISPLLRVCKGHAPILIMHGLLDKVVKPEDSIQYHYALKDMGCDSTIKLLPDVGHAFILFDYRLENKKVYGILQQVENYLKEKQLL